MQQMNTLDVDPYLALAAAGPGSEVDEEEEDDVDMTDAPLVSHRFVDNEADESDSPEAETAHP